MDGFQLTIMAKAFNQRQWQDDPARHERRGPDGENLGAGESSKPIWSAAILTAAISVLAFALLIGGALLPSGPQDLSPVAASAPEGILASLFALGAAPPNRLVEFLWQTTGGPGFPPDAIGGAIAPDGNPWVPDGRNHRFQNFTPEYGQASAEFDGAANLYVVDSGNRRIQAKFMITTTALSLMLSLGATLVPPTGCHIVAVWEDASAVAACSDGNTWFEFDPDITRDGLWSVSRREPPELVALR